ncbi:hypothetical protein [Paenibacillus eucommiae]|uniref:ABC-type transport system involved in multi-copper enzyme maturation permease subunit n=1 Tax=Paenibacillus eucommiae TaxID=1355755 RepID=A0ABS4J912_9BACL|nr:hypothetical protein [Paenibacillus eucommiae]MBP1996338.1 ABC-type transport system involved in multi-copper enzyme maturation permease subunit [Paenibacillus eucommiae]
MNRMLLNLKLINSSLIWAAAGIAVIQVLVINFMENMEIVTKTQLFHVQAIYEYSFPLVAIFIMSQLFAEELEPGVALWVMALPFRSWSLLLYRWSLGMGLLVLLYAAGVILIHLGQIPIPFLDFTYDVLPPALWLGNLAMLATLIGRSFAAGLGVPLFYWVVETISNGALSRKLYLFAGMASDNPDLVWNRNMLLLLSLLALLGGGFLFSRRSYFIKK